MKLVYPSEFHIGEDVVIKEGDEVKIDLNGGWVEVKKDSGITVLVTSEPERERLRKEIEVQTRHRIELERAKQLEMMSYLKTYNYTQDELEIKKQQYELIKKYTAADYNELKEKNWLMQKLQKVRAKK